MIVMNLKSHKEGIIGKPMSVALYVFFIICGFVAAFFKKTSISLTKKCVSGVKESTVVNSYGVVLVFVKLFLCKQSFLLKDIKVNKIWVACNCGG